ncbi:hypothetical protein OG429_13675 [Streptomyces sp. NBC_00190]|uniref:hypothetical protein n=1 Tax=Streptomyces sp. NBC_00190 TaxID=2903634 RepID=UPI002E280524|nr:hypothetical protein [Streptomyces sp. NBC_00190]
MRFAVRRGDATGEGLDQMVTLHVSGEWSDGVTSDVLDVVRVRDHFPSIVNAMLGIDRQVRADHPGERVLVKLLEAGEEWDQLPLWPKKRDVPRALRAAVFAACESKCVLCDVDDPDMLDYGHILDRPATQEEIPWHLASRDEWANRHADRLEMGVVPSDHGSTHRMRPSGRR